MRSGCFIVALLAEVALCSGCARPDHVDRIESPWGEGVFFTVETHHGRGPLSSDFTRVYAHLESNGKSDRKLVLDGEYLENTKVSWHSSYDVTLCVPDGYTDSFRTYVTLDSGGVSKTIHSHLQEQCTTK